MLEQERMEEEDVIRRAQGNLLNMKTDKLHYTEACLTKEYLIILWIEIRNNFFECSPMLLPKTKSKIQRL